MRSDNWGWASIGVIALMALAGGHAARRSREGAGPRRPGRLGDRAAYAPGVAAGAGDRGTRGDVRPAGPEGVRDADPNWDRIDEALDESFPASDPPATY